MMSSRLQGNAGCSCLLLWNAKNVASPRHGPFLTLNAKKRTSEDSVGGGVNFSKKGLKSVLLNPANV